MSFFHRYLIKDGKRKFHPLFIAAFGVCIGFASIAQKQTKIITGADLKRNFQSPPKSAKPWVFWYWMQASVSKEGITADMEAMKESGIAGAYLMPIKGPANPPYMDPPIIQLSPAWWGMVMHALKEGKRLGLKLAMHLSDGFALAGGPWITPELSMQKVVWTRRQVEGGTTFNDTLSQPQTIEGYYKDIAVFAYPSPIGTGLSTRTIIPTVTSNSNTSDARLLIAPGNTKSFSCDDLGWIQYEFERPFTCRSILISSRNNYQANRLIVEVSDDGKKFRSIGRLEPPRHGWQDVDEAYTHVIPAITSRFFRFVYDKTGSEPGSEDLDAAKWKASLKITGIELSSEPRIDEYEGKSGAVWRISKRTTTEQVPEDLCVPLKSMIELTKNIDSKGRLHWNIPAGHWTILRMGHTSTGHTNETAGGGKGLECDKFNPVAVKLEFDSWFGQAIKHAGPELAKEVLEILHVDSWECGSQNWSSLFRGEFKKRRGYDLLPYLPVMAGIPVQSIDVSERFLYDIRQTISELIVDNFYVTLSKLAKAKGVTFCAESVAPTMLSDGMAHYQQVDLPMGEFWLRSPTHDKPNDMLDAISGAHIYGKSIIQAEAFTELRLAWDEYPGMLKTLQDRNYAIGINRLVYHVFMHNPWLDRKPGMSLDGIGLFFQRDQTWWKPGGAWVKYAQRCQALLQIGRPVADIAVFTGEELPRRSIIPDRLVSTLPGIFGKKIVESEARRLANVGEPLRTMPQGVTHSANMADPENWIDPLKGYAYDSYNKDALLHLSKVNNGNIELAGGANYKLLVLPGVMKMSPNPELMSEEVATKLKTLVENGATILVNERAVNSPGLKNFGEGDKVVRQVTNSLWKGDKNTSGDQPAGFEMWKVGKGRVIKGPFTANSFEALGIERDFLATDLKGNTAGGIAWTHRTAPGLDIYFISNQEDSRRIINLSLRVEGRIPELWDPLTGEAIDARVWNIQKGITHLPLQLEPAGSLFVVLQRPAKKLNSNEGKNWKELKSVQSVDGPWTVSFDPRSAGPSTPVVFNALADWSKHADSAIRYYSGSATYLKTFDWQPLEEKNTRLWLNVGHVANIAEIIVNGINCGVAWTSPYMVDITGAIRPGKNELKIEVTNTWANRIIGDQRLPESKRVTKTNAPFRLEGKPLLEAGLLGPVTIEAEKR